MCTYGLGTCPDGGPRRGVAGTPGWYGGFTVVGMSERTRGLTLVVATNTSATEPPATVVWRALAEECLRAGGGGG